jgi:hypothetical protein
MPLAAAIAPKRRFSHGIQEREVFLGPWRTNVDEIIGGI